MVPPDMFEELVSIIKTAVSRASDIFQYLAEHAFFVTIQWYLFMGYFLRVESIAPHSCGQSTPTPYPK